MEETLIMIRNIKRLSLLAGVACLGFALSAAVEADDDGPPGKAAESKNMRLVGHHPMQGRSIYNGHVRKQGGRYIAYVGFHSGTSSAGFPGRNGNAIVDVTDPRNPVFLVHIAPDAANAGARRGARSLQTCSGEELGTGDPNRVYMHREVQNATQEIWDVTVPESPKFVTNVGGPYNDTHKNWWECSTGIAYLTNSAREGDPQWNTRVMSIWDLSDPTDPMFIRNYIGLPGAQPGRDTEGRRMTDVHEPLYLDGRVYLAHGTRTDGILQILDNDELLNGSFNPLDPSDEELLAPVISRLDWPDFQGVHTAVPILGMELPEFAGFGANNRDMLVAVNESTRNECTEDMHQMVYMVDITDPAHPIPISTYFVPEASGNFCSRGGRFGAHTTQWNIREENYRGRIIWVSYFNAGVRGVDIRDPYNPKEVAFYIPAVTENTTERCVEINGVDRCKIAIQTNNLDVDDRGFIYAFDRANTGMHILEPTGKARKIAGLSKRGKKGDDDDD